MLIKIIKYFKDAQMEPEWKLKEVAAIRVTKGQFEN